jgi:hypothetical protein
MTRRFPRYFEAAVDPILALARGYAEPPGRRPRGESTAAPLLGLARARLRPESRSPRRLQPVPAAFSAPGLARKRCENGLATATAAAAR